MFNRFQILIGILSFLYLFTNGLKAENEICSQFSGSFLFSKALQYQTIANHSLSRNNSSYFQSHRKAIEYFKFYIECASIQGYSVTNQSRFLKAYSHFEAKEFTESLKELEVSLSEKTVPHKESLILKAKILQKQLKTREAAQVLESAISQYSEDSDLLFLLGSINADIGNFSKSVLYFTSLYQLIQKKEGDIRYKIITLKLLGDIYFKKADIPKSIHYYKLYLSLRENDYEVIYTMAQLYFLSGNMEESRANLNKILKANPDAKGVIQLLAEFHFIENRLNSLKYFETLHKENKIKEDTILSAIYKLLNDKTKESEDFLNNFLVKNPNRLSARIALGLIYSKQEKIDDYANQLKITSEIAYSNKLFTIALDQLKELLLLAEKYPELKLNKSQIYQSKANCEEESGNPESALLSIKKSIELSSDEKDKNAYKLHLANIYRNSKIKKFEESNQLLLEITSSNNPNVFFMIGLNYFSLEKYKDSISYLTKAIERAPENPNFYFFRASSYDKVKLIPQTISDLKKAIELDPNNPVNYNYLGYLYTENDMELEEAKKNIKRAIELEPDNSAYQDSMGWLFYKIGNYKESLHHLNLAEQIMLDKKEDDPVIYDHLGDVYFKLNEKEFAVENWKKSSSLQKNKAEKEKILSKIKKVPNLE